MPSETFTLVTISDDVWFEIFFLLTPFDFMSVSHTCSLFYNLYSMKNKAIDRYWKYQCKKLWTKINETNFESKNWKILFKSMVDFIVSGAHSMLITIQDSHREESD